MARWLEHCRGKLAAKYVLKTLKHQLSWFIGRQPEGRGVTETHSFIGRYVCIANDQVNLLYMLMKCADGRCSLVVAPWRRFKHSGSCA